MADEAGTRQISGYNELGQTGLKHFAGTLYEEYLPELQGSRAYKVYTEMAEHDPVIGGSIYAIESLLRSVPWATEPATEDPTDIELADFIDECFHDMTYTMEDTISEILTMIRHGWSYFEVVYKKREGAKGRVPSRFDDGLIGWRKFAPRSQDTLYRWRIDSDGGIKGMWQYPWPTGEMEPMAGGSGGPNNDSGRSLVFIPIEKALLFRTTSTKNSPQGRSLLRSAYRPWFFGKRMEEIEAIGLERDLAGLPIAYVPVEVLAQNRTAEAEHTFRYIRDIVKKTKQDQQHGIVFPRAFDEDGNELFGFELLSTGGRRAFDTGAIITRYNQAKAMALMTDFILLGHENVGSFALSSDKTELFSVALGSLLDSIEDVFNRYAIPRLLKLNGIEVGDRQPMIRHGDIEKPDLAALIQYVQGLANAGAPLFPDLVLENHLRGLADLPSITEEERERVMMAQTEMQMAQQQAMMEAMGGGAAQDPMQNPGPGGMNMFQQMKPGGGQGGGQHRMVGFPGAGNAGPAGGGGGQRQPGSATSGGPGRPAQMNTLKKAAREQVAKMLEGVEV